MVCIGGFVIDYDSFLRRYGKDNRGIMRYDAMVNYHDYYHSQWKIEEAIGIERWSAFKTPCFEEEVAQFKFKNEKIVEEYRLGEGNYSIEDIEKFASRDYVESAEIIEYKTYSRVVRKIK